MSITNDSGLRPLEFYVVVELEAVEEKTAGGIFLPGQTLDADEMANQEGMLIAASPHAFDYATDWPEGAKPKIGDRVLFKRYDGSLHKRNGRSYRLLNDKSLIAIVEPQSVALSAAA